MLPTDTGSGGPAWPRFRIGPVVVDALRREQLVAALVAAAATPRGLTAVYLNAHVFERLYRDPELARAMAVADLVFCDGWGARLGLRALGAAVPERMTPPDFVDEIFARLARARFQVFLLGDEPAVAAEMAARLDQRWPGLAAGHHHGFFGADEEPALLERIRASGARVVFVGMGTPRQERWIADLRAAAPELGALAVGGLFRWYTGTETRGPRWLTDHGFEWLCRLVVQPRRVAGRYLVGLPRFAWRITRLRLGGERAHREPAPITG